MDLYLSAMPFVPARVVRRDRVREGSVRAANRTGLLAPLGRTGRSRIGDRTRAACPVAMWCVGVEDVLSGRSALSRIAFAPLADVCTHASVGHVDGNSEDVK